MQWLLRVAGGITQPNREPQNLKEPRIQRQTKPKADSLRHNVTFIGVIATVIAHWLVLFSCCSGSGIAEEPSFCAMGSVLCVWWIFGLLRQEASFLRQAKGGRRNAYQHTS